MAVSLAKTTYSIEDGIDGTRSKEYATPRNAMKFAGPRLPKGEHQIIATTEDKERVLVTFLRS